MPFKLPRLLSNAALVDGQGKAKPTFAQWWDIVVSRIEEAIQDIVTLTGIQDDFEAALASVDAATAAAQAAADAANAATAAQKSENSLINSFVKNPDNPVSADSTGLVTIVAHQRQYGDPTLNPTVSVNGGTLTTGAAAGSVIRVYYDQASRAGGTVTYQYTTDPATPPVQGGVRHSVGAVTIPLAGSQAGGGARPPGYANPIP